MRILQPTLRTAATLAAFLAAPSLAQAPAASEALALRELRPATMAATLTEIGQAVTLVEQDAQRARLRQNDDRYNLYLEGCADGLCRFVQIRICVASKRGTAETANQWNAGRVFARAAAHPSGLYCLENSVHAADGRMTLAALRSAIDGLMSNASWFWSEFSGK